LTSWLAMIGPIAKPKFTAHVCNEYARFCLRNGTTSETYAATAGVGTEEITPYISNAIAIIQGSPIKASKTSIAAEPKLPMTIIAGRPNRSDNAPPYRQPKMPPKPYMETMVPATPALTCMSETRYMERNDVTKRPIHRMSNVTHKPQNMTGKPKISLLFSIPSIISVRSEAAVFPGVLGQ